MLEFFIQRLRTISCQAFQVIGAIALLIFVSLGIPVTAQAATTVSLDNTPEVVNVIAVYPTTPDTQSQTVSELVREEKAAFSNTPGFQSASILQAEDGSQAIALSQWKGKDLSSFQSYASERVVKAATGAKPQTFACQVQHTETRGKSLSFDAGDAVMFSQFKMKPGKVQSELATVVGQMMAGVLQMIPGLQWAAMCPSIDKSTIALIARWNSRDDFESLGQKPGFDKETNYWEDYANNEHGLYDVVQVIS